MSSEFRVRWQRQGRGQSTRIYQTWSAAYRRYLTIKCWDDVKEGSRYEDMPDLEYVVLESRECPEWTPHDFQPEITDGFREATRKGILYREPFPAGHDDNEFPF
jgi:hypothetical protein